MFIPKAKKEDVNAIFELIKELAAFQNQSSALLITPEDLDGFTDHRQFHCLIADDDQEIIGIAFYSYGYSIWVGKSIKLDDLIVKDTQREKGIGFQLLNELIKIARIEQIRRVSWFVYNWNSKAIEFYKKSRATVQMSY